MGNLANCRENTRCIARSPVSGVNHSRRSRPATAVWNRHESASKLSAPTAIQGGDALADERPSELSDALADRTLGRWMTDNSCSLALGGGTGLNLVVKARGLVKYLVGISRYQPSIDEIFDSLDSLEYEE